MRPHLGAPPSRRRFLALPAAGTAAGATTSNGCARQVSSGVSVSGETVTAQGRPHHPAAPALR